VKEFTALILFLNKLLMNSAFGAAVPAVPLIDLHPA
jgi:hypothetical protein